jgi:hypothetical protein
MKLNISWQIQLSPAARQGILSPGIFVLESVLHVGSYLL